MNLLNDSFKCIFPIQWSKVCLELSCIPNGFSCGSTGYCLKNQIRLKTGWQSGFTVDFLLSESNEMFHMTIQNIASHQGKVLIQDQLQMILLIAELDERSSMGRIMMVAMGCG